MSSFVCSAIKDHIYAFGRAQGNLWKKMKIVFATDTSAGSSSLAKINPQSAHNKYDWIVKCKLSD